MTIHFDESKQNSRVADLHKREEEDLAAILSDRYGIPYADLSGFSIDTDGLRLIPEDTARASRAAGFDLVGKKLKLAIMSPNREETQALIKDLENRGYIVSTYLVSTASLDRAWSRYKDISFATETKAGSLDISSEEMSKFIKDVKSIESVRELINDVMKMNKAFRISRIVEIILAGAIATGSSDVHIEPEENDVRVRFRLDGVLTDIVRLDIETYKLILSRIKLLSGMKLNVKNNSQDGRFSIVIDQSEIEIRSSILPGAYNESIVMRLLNPDSIAVTLESLGMEPYLLEIFMREINKPNGMVLNTGPTGSGKTTTLYAFMRNKKTPAIKIITIEDPIEYHLEGIVQTQVDNKKGYDFAKGLKSSLRQDPDVIMVGEIRDIETAETAIHAALTGHLVFSTLHTNNAAGAFTRLIDLGINPKILTSAINVAIAQRLVRRLCQSCRKEIPIPENRRATIEKLYNTMPQKLVPLSNTMYEAVGCHECNGLGYKGRIGIYEAVISDKSIEEVLQTNPSEREIKLVAQKQGILDMAQDGLVKVLKGITTLEEVDRVVDLDNREGYNDIKSEDPNLPPTDIPIRAE